MSHKCIPDDGQAWPKKCRKHLCENVIVYMFQYIFDGNDLILWIVWHSKWWTQLSAFTSMHNFLRRDSPSAIHPQTWNCILAFWRKNEDNNMSSPTATMNNASAWQMLHCTFCILRPSLIHLHIAMGTTRVSFTSNAMRSQCCKLQYFMCFITTTRQVTWKYLCMYINRNNTENWHKVANQQNVGTKP